VKIPPAASVPLVNSVRLVDRVVGKIDISTLQMELINPLVDPGWDRQVDSHPLGTVFHGRAWARVLTRTYGHGLLYARLWRGEDLAGLIPLVEVRSRITGCRGACLAFSDACPPLLFAHDALPFAAEKLIQLARERKWKYLDIRGGPCPQPDAIPSMEFFTHHLNLRQGEAGLLESVSSSARRAIRSGERKGLRVEMIQTEVAMRQYYQLHVRTRRRHGLPPQPPHFFLNIFDEFVARGRGAVVQASMGSRVVASAVFLWNAAKEAVYKFGASDERRSALRGNYAVMWHAIRTLASAGYKTLDFGRTSLSNEGLCRFKRSWGATQGRLEYYRYDVTDGAWTQVADHAEGWHNRAFRLLPLVINRVAGRLIYPHLH